MVHFFSLIQTYQFAIDVDQFFLKAKIHHDICIFKSLQEKDECINACEVACQTGSDNQMIRTNRMKNADFMPFEITDANVYCCPLANSRI